MKEEEESKSVGYTIQNNDKTNLSPISFLQFSVGYTIQNNDKTNS